MLEYNSRVVHRSGTLLVIPDALSQAHRLSYSGTDNTSALQSHIARMHEVPARNELSGVLDAPSCVSSLLCHDEGLVEGPCGSGKVIEARRLCPGHIMTTRDTPQ